VRAAQVPHAQPQAGAVQGPDPGPGVELRLRRPGSCRRALHQLPAQEDRRRAGAAHPHGPRRRLRAQARWLMFARLAAVLSLRTISGKLIIGLLVLFGVASVIISVITAQSLNRSLMSSLDQQVQAATHTWFDCVQQSTINSKHNDPDHHAGQPDPDDYKMCSESGQAPGTFVEMLA